MVKSYAPGKLLLSGEWSVLEVGNPAIVLSVNKGVHAEVVENDAILLNFPDIGIAAVNASYDGELRLMVSNDKLNIPKSAIELTLRYLELRGFAPKTFTLTTKSEISQVVLGDGSSAKIGFGSSAASAVAIVAALLKYHGMTPSKEIIYKLSALAHYLAQGKIGSGFDIAASTFGGVFVYTRFDPEWLMHSYEELQLNELIETTWPGFGVHSLALPENFVLSVGWTQKSASTTELVKKVREFKAANRPAYDTIMSNIASVTKELINKFEDSAVFELLEDNRKLLVELGLASGVQIETPELAKLAEVARANGGVGKLSGAGGGDCGIAITFDKSQAERIKSEWNAVGLYPLDVNITEAGVVVE